VMTVVVMMELIWIKENWVKHQEIILCDSMDCSPPGSSVHGILQAKILEWVAVPSSRDLPSPGIKPTCTAAPAL